MSLLDGTKLPSNTWRWIFALALGFLAGMLTVIADSASWPGFYPLVRGGVIDMLPTSVALKITLTKTRGSNLNVGGGPPMGGTIKGSH